MVLGGQKSGKETFSVGLPCLWRQLPLLKTDILHSCNLSTQGGETEVPPINFSGGMGLRELEPRLPKPLLKQQNNMKTAFQPLSFASGYVNGAIFIDHLVQL